MNDMGEDWEYNGCRKDINESGYVRVYLYKKLSISESEHRLVWSDSNYMNIPDNWHIHHINRIRDDNRQMNLIAVPPSIHRLIHSYEDSFNIKLDKEDIYELITTGNIKRSD